MRNWTYNVKNTNALVKRNCLSITGDGITLDSDSYNSRKYLKEMGKVIIDALNNWEDDKRLYNAVAEQLGGK